MHVNKTNKYHQTRNLTIAPIDLSLGGQETPICPLSTLSVIAFFLPPRGIYLGGVEWFERGDRERSISWRSQERGPRNPHCIFDTPLSVLYSRAVCILAITLAYQRFTDGYIRRQNMANLACLLGLFFSFLGVISGMVPFYTSPSCTRRLLHPKGPGAAAVKGHSTFAIASLSEPCLQIRSPSSSRLSRGCSNRLSD